MSDGVMIAFLPSEAYYVKQPLPHMTLVYAGTVDELKPSDLSELAKDAISAARLCGSFMLDVTGVDEFGEGDEAVEVLTLYPTPQLLVARRLVERWNASEYKDFKPHVTIGPIGSAWEAEQSSILPSKVYFDRVLVAWGDKHLTFSSSQHY